MEDIGFCVHGKDIVLGVVGTGFENAFWGAFHERDVCSVDEIVVNYCHAFDCGIEMVFLDVGVTNSIFDGLDILQG
jgi:hypothetical protein